MNCLKSNSYSARILPLVSLLLTLTTGVAVRADDWPQWLGPQRDGVWRETGIVDKFPAGEFMAKVPRKIKPEAGEAQSRIESARGEMAYYVVSDGGERAYSLPR